jgi:malate dehydrogenase
MSSAQRITVVGAGHVGMLTAQKCAEKELAREIVLIDVVEGRPQGIALDLNQSAAVEGWSSRVVGTNDPAATADSDLVIVTAGKPRTPGMSRSDLLSVNGKIVEQVARYVRERSSEAIVIVVTNPLDPMTALMRAKLAFPARRVLGMAGVLDAARFSFFLADELGIGVADVDAMVLGAHGDSMVPLPRASTANGVPVGELLDKSTIQALAERTKNGGAEIVNLLKSGSAFFAPASGAVAMAKSILRDEKRLLPCTCLLNGEFGIEGVYVGVPAVLGRGGVERIHELPLDTEARIAMQKTVGAVQKDVEALRQLGMM